MNASLARLCEQFDTHLNPIPKDVGFTANEYAAAKGISQGRARRTIACLVKDGVLEKIGVKVVIGSDEKNHPAPAYDFVKKVKCKSKR